MWFSSFSCEEVEPISLLLNLVWCCNLLWPMKYDEYDAVADQGLGLKKIWSLHFCSFGNHVERIEAPSQKPPPRFQTYEWGHLVSFSPRGAILAGTTQRGVQWPLLSLATIPNQQNCEELNDTCFKPLRFGLDDYSYRCYHIASG